MIQIDEKFFVEEDSRCWILIERKGHRKTKEGALKFDKNGKPEYTEEYSYHANLRQALIWYLQASQSSSATIHEAINRMSEAEARIETAFAGKLTEKK